MDATETEAVAGERVDKRVTCRECDEGLTYDVDRADNEADGPDSRRLAWTRYHHELTGHRSFVVDYA